MLFAGRTKSVEDPLALLRQKVAFVGVKEKRGPLQLNEQRGNVIENKGLLWKTSGQSGNVIDNKVHTTLFRECY